MAPALLRVLAAGLALGVGAATASPSLRAHHTPTGLSPETTLLWERSLAAERAGRFLESARAREQILEARPGQVHTLWRAARDYLRAADPLAEDEPERAIALIQRARRLAQRGRELDPGCAECCFYDFAALAKEGATAGLMSSLALLRDTRPILELCLQNPPSWRDSDWHSEEALLYFSAAQFWRLTPDSRIVERAIGFRGNLQRAIHYARKANTTQPDRVDLRTELGTALLCLGERDSDAEATREGRAILGSLAALPERLRTDPADKRRAQWLLANPNEACSASRNVRMN